MSDPWVWDLLFSDAGEWPYEYDQGAGTFDLPNLPSGGPVVQLRLHVHGRTDHQHAVEARINGALVGTASFAGKASALIEGAISSDVLRPTANSLTLTYTATGGNPAVVGLLYLGDLEMSLPEDLSAPAQVDRISSYDPALPAMLRDPDYLIVTHELFRDQADRLADIKRTEGLRPLVVDVERAYDLFSGGIVEAAAVRRLIQTLAPRLRYVLLLGDDTFDTHDYLGTGAVSFVPSLLAWDGEFGRIPSENRYADLDGDGRPDVAIGRLPAQTPAEADVMVDKIAQAAAVVAASDKAHVFAVDNTGPLDSASFRERGATGGAAPAAGLHHHLCRRRRRDRGRARCAVRGPARRAARDALLRPRRSRGVGRRGAADRVRRGRAWTWTRPRCSSTGPARRAGIRTCFGPSINEALLLAPGKGAMAAFGPTGATDPREQKALYMRVYAPVAPAGH